MTAQLLHIPLRAVLVTKEERAARAGKQLMVIKTYRPENGFLLDAPQPRLYPATPTRAGTKAK